MDLFFIVKCIFFYKIYILNKNYFSKIEIKLNEKGDIYETFR